MFDSQAQPLPGEDGRKMPASGAGAVLLEAGDEGRLEAWLRNTEEAWQWNLWATSLRCKCWTWSQCGDSRPLCRHCHRCLHRLCLKPSSSLSKGSQWLPLCVSVSFLKWSPSARLPANMDVGNLKMKFWPETSFKVGLESYQTEAVVREVLPKWKSKTWKVSSGDWIVASHLLFPFQAACKFLAALSRETSAAAALPSLFFRPSPNTKSWKKSNPLVSLISLFWTTWLLNFHRQILASQKGKTIAYSPIFIHPYSIHLHGVIHLFSAAAHAWECNCGREGVIGWFLNAFSSFLCILLVRWRTMIRSCPIMMSSITNWTTWTDFLETMPWLYEA